MDQRESDKKAGQKPKQQQDLRQLDERARKIIKKDQSQLVQTSQNQQDANKSAEQATHQKHGSLSQRKSSLKKKFEEGNIQDAFGLGEYYYHFEQYENAILHLDKAIKQNTSIGRAYYFKGLVQIQCKQYLQALNSLCQSQRISPLILEVQTQISLAINLHNSQIWDNLQSLKLCKEMQFDENQIHKLIKEAIQEQQNIDAQYQLLINGIQLIDTQLSYHNQKLCNMFYKKAYQIYHLIKQLRKKKQNDENQNYKFDMNLSLQYINLGLCLYKENLEYYKLKGKILMELKQYDKAILEFKTVLKKDSEQSKVYELLSECYIKQNKLDRAIQCQKYANTLENDYSIHFIAEQQLRKLLEGQKQQK